MKPPVLYARFKADNRLKPVAATVGNACVFNSCPKEKKHKAVSNDLKGCETKANRETKEVRRVRSVWYQTVVVTVLFMFPHNSCLKKITSIVTVYIHHFNFEYKKRVFKLENNWIINYPSDFQNNWLSVRQTTEFNIYKRKLVCSTDCGEGDGLSVEVTWTSLFHWCSRSCCYYPL